VRRIVVLISLSLLALTAVPAEAAAVISVDDFFFAPGVATLTSPGETVTWDWAAGVNYSHSVRQESLLFSSGTSSNPDASYERTFSAGSFSYYCGIHGGSMDGRVRVPVLIAAAPTGLPFTVRWATSGTNVGQVFDVQYRVGIGMWRTWRSDATVRAKVFGANGKPVVVKAGRTYEFRVRTQLSAAQSLSRSGWSPVRTFGV
jgi:plastocyanin